jgi:hypothetical protein
MGVRINGVWHEELADPGTGGSDTGNGRNYSSASDYAAVSGGGGGGGSAPAPVAFNPQASTAAMNAAGYADTPEGRASYAARTAGAAATPAGQQKYVDPTIQKQILDGAQQAAYQAYLNAKLNLDSEDLAFRKATQAFANAVSAAQLTGTYDGAPTLAAQQQEFQHGIEAAGLTGVYNGAPTLAAQNQQQQTSLGYLKLIGDLRGPQNYGQYLRVLGSTPDGLRSLVASAAGQYTPAGGATTGVAPQAASLGGLAGDAASGAAGGATYADYMNTAQGLPAPNQISPAAWNTYTTSQKQGLLGMYESMGWNPTDVQDLYQQSLPKYTFSGPVSGRVKI